MAAPAALPAPAMTATAEYAPAAPRAMGLWAAVALVVGSQLGTGVFTLPASLAPYGLNAMIGWGATIAGALSLAIVFGRLAVRVPQAEGPYGYTRAAFGAVPGFVVAWSYWIYQWVSNGAVAVASIGYVAVFLPGLGADRLAATGAAIAAVWLFTLLNLLGAGAVGRVAVVATAAKALPLVAVALLAAWVLAHHGAAALTPAPAPITGGGIAATALLTLWALVGIESATVPAGKIVDPTRTIPRATLWGTGFSAAISVVVVSAVMLMGPAGAIAVSSAPIADFAARWAGGAWAVPIAAAAALSGLGVLPVGILFQGEVPAAMARAGVFPAVLGRVDARGTPVIAHLVTSALLSVVLLMNASDTLIAVFNFIIQLAVLAALVAYVTCALAAVRLRVGGPGFVAVALFAAAYSAWALTGADAKSLTWFGGLMAAGLPVYLLTRSRTRGGATSPARAGAAASLPG